MNHARLTEWIRDQAPELATMFAAKDPALAMGMSRKLEEEQGLDDEVWARHFEDTFGFKPETGGNPR